MTTLTEMVAAVVVHSSAVAFSHFGVVLDARAEPPPALAEQRIVSRTPRKVEPVRPVLKAPTCPDAPRVAILKV